MKDVKTLTDSNPLWNNTVLSLAIGSSIPSDTADIGDKYDFTLRIELPEVSDASPLSVLVSGTNPGTETSSIKICSPNIKKIVSVKYAINPFNF